jgi:hypothetical protein
MELTDLTQRRKRTKQLKQLRRGLIKQLYPKGSIRTVLQNPNQEAVLLLDDLIGSFKRFAGNQQTAFDNGTARSSVGNGNSGDIMEKRVERAISQVLGRGAGGNFISALNSAFPATTDGQVTFTPSRSAVYSPSISSYNGSNIGTGSWIGQLPSKQAALYREASILAADALKVLENLTTFSPKAEADRVEALRALVRSEINAFVDEVGRLDSPRPERVQSYLDSLVINLDEFGAQAFLNDPVSAVSIDDEAQITGLNLLKNYVRTLGRIWKQYYDSVRPSSPRSYSLSERVERVNVLLPIVAQTNNYFEEAMDSVGFSESERRSFAFNFRDLGVPPIIDFDAPQKMQRAVALGGPPLSNPIDTALPNITVNDLTEWLDRFATIEGPSVLSASGQYGLDFVTEQADILFWNVGAIVAHMKTTVALNASSRTTFEQFLSNERVTWALDNLLSQLNSLADQAE